MTKLTAKAKLAREAARLKRIKKQVAQQNAKRKERSPKALNNYRKRVKALGVAPYVSVPKNYVNPISGKAPPRGKVVYKLTNNETGRINYYTKETLFRFLKNEIRNSYNLLMANPKAVLFKNPVTYKNVKPRNIQRVRITKAAKTPSPNAAARKIQNAMRAYLKKKKAAKK